MNTEIIELTDKALSYLNDLTKSNSENDGIRVSVIGGGCSRFLLQNRLW